MNLHKIGIALCAATMASCEANRKYEIIETRAFTSSSNQTVVSFSQSCQVASVAVEFFSVYIPGGVVYARQSEHTRSIGLQVGDTVKLVGSLEYIEQSSISKLGYTGLTTMKGVIIVPSDLTLIKRAAPRND